MGGGRGGPSAAARWPGTAGDSSEPSLQDESTIVGGDCQEVEPIVLYFKSNHRNNKQVTVGAPQVGFYAQAGGPSASSLRGHGAEWGTPRSFCVLFHPLRGNRTSVGELKEPRGLRWKVAPPLMACHLESDLNPPFTCCQGAFSELQNQCLWHNPTF